MPFLVPLSQSPRKTFPWWAALPLALVLAVVAAALLPTSDADRPRPDAA